MMYAKRISFLLSSTTTFFLLVNGQGNTSVTDVLMNQKCENNLGICGNNIDNSLGLLHPIDPEAKLNDEIPRKNIPDITQIDIIADNTSELLFTAEPQTQELSKPSGITAEAAARLRYGKDNILLGEMEKQQGGKLFGRVLDAGTGLSSLRWIATLGENKLGMTSYSAVTGSKNMQEKMQKEAKELGVASMGEIIFRNWFDKRNPVILNEKYDTILVDYLIGSLDGFSPYKQDQMLAILESYLKPGGRMYIIGLEPIPDYVSRNDPTTNNIPGANMICHLRQMRDSSLLLAGQRPYCEYPMEWVQRQLEKMGAMTVLKAMKFGNLWDFKMFSSQIKNGNNALKHIPSKNLAHEMGLALNELEKQFSMALKEAEGKIKFGFDYLITAEKKS